ncbi:MAG: universal stress protein [Myxococcota bacterium]|nr:universal stress protein [Myxococcota bacterium]
MSAFVGHPIVIAVPLDHGAEDVIDAAAALASRLGAPVLPVHAIGASANASDVADARASIESWLGALARRGVTVQPLVIEAGRPEQVIPAIAARAGAPLTIVGSGRGSTIRDWLLGTSAERIVRASAGPVWIARGTLPSEPHPVLVPIDLGEHTRVSIIAGARWSRLFGTPLRLLHVLPEVEPRGDERTARRIDELTTAARTRIVELVDQIDLDFVPIEIRLTHGPIGATLVREAEDAGLVAITQPDYEMLVPASLGSHVERLMRTSRASVIAVRDGDAARQRAMREERARWVASLRSEAEQALEDGDPARAERLLLNAKIAAPASPRIEDVLARAVELQGRSEEAERHRGLARWLRAELE